MKIIFAQGNPGPEYKSTRHNIGYTIIDKYAQVQNAEFTHKPKFFASVAEIGKGDDKILLAKPTTYYNETGRSARALVDFYKIDPASDLLVIHDDIALPFGLIRVRAKGSDAGNRGVRSISATFGQDYHRIRVGVNNDLLKLHQLPAHDFVLSRFSKAEQKQLPEVIKKAIGLIDGFRQDALEVQTLN